MRCPILISILEDLKIQVSMTGLPMQIVPKSMKANVLM